MANTYNPIKCKSCARVLATVSATGLSPTTSADAVGCDTCGQFNALYDAVQAADAEWALFESKRETITKLCALEKHKKVRMEFDNWLMSVEAPATLKSVEHEDLPDNATAEEQDLFNSKEQVNQGIKRRRSHSSTALESGDSNTQDVVSGSPPHQLQGLPLSLRPSPKHSRSSASLPERKRLKFSDSVEFRDNYRGSEEYHRPSETYVRGRNAPPEGSEYMDTSGSGQTFLKFTGMKKIGGKWVEVNEEELAKKKKDAKASAELRKIEAAQKSVTQGGNDEVAAEMSQDGEALLDPRAARLARRAKGSSSAGRARSTSPMETRDGRLSKETKAIPLERASKEIQGPSSEPGPKAPSPVTDGAQHSVDKDAGATNNVGKDGKEVVDGVVKSSLEPTREVVDGVIKSSPEPTTEGIHNERTSCRAWESVYTASAHRMGGSNQATLERDETTPILQPPGVWDADNSTTDQTPTSKSPTLEPNLPEPAATTPKAPPEMSSALDHLNTTPQPQALPIPPLNKQEDP
ncbi:hypothetical protein BDW02DRAFT_564582 [Decorospora gaudefroyi]|uniref:Uncharacterized protein n=1 Tax=Decorospora gaudefroyi TaxID=184978 RepID=A0A6A5KTH3_9PLEO|nr:hypothetical protein BDW02DRAFT_564582 [Decorospora gaudefroyi]